MQGEGRADVRSRSDLHGEVGRRGGGDRAGSVEARKAGGAETRCGEVVARHGWSGHGAVVAGSGGGLLLVWIRWEGGGWGRLL